MNTEDRIKALLIERAGYERRGLNDRVKAVDEQLAAAGHQTPRPARTEAAESRGRRTAKG